MVVGLSMFTLGFAAATGADGAAPILKVLDVDCGYLGSDLDVGGSG